MKAPLQCYAWCVTVAMVLTIGYMLGVRVPASLQTLAAMQTATTTTEAAWLVDSRQLELPAEWRNPNDFYMLVSDAGAYMCRRDSDNAWIASDVSKIRTETKALRNGDRVGK